MGKLSLKLGLEFKPWTRRPQTFVVDIIVALPLYSYHLTGVAAELQTVHFVCI